MTCWLARSSHGSWGLLCLPSASSLAPAARRTCRSGRPFGRPADLGTGSGWWLRGQSVFLQGFGLWWMMVLCKFPYEKKKPPQFSQLCMLCAVLKHPVNNYLALRNFLVISWKKFNSIFTRLRMIWEGICKACLWLGFVHHFVPVWNWMKVFSNCVCRFLSSCLASL